MEQRRFMSPRQRNCLLSYKYNGVDQSVLADYVLSYYWNWLLSYLPKSFAPNLLTLCGWICCSSSYVLWLYYCPPSNIFSDFAAPNFVYIVFAIQWFVYQTLDNLDGKQARRTNTSSPLGEIFDHGSDSTLTMIGITILGSSLSFGPFGTFFAYFFCIAIFYATHWEAYFTGVLLLRAESNPTEAEMSLILCLLFTGIVGPSFWRTLVDLPYLGATTYGTIYLGVITVMTLNGLFTNVMSVVKHHRSIGRSLLNPFLCFLPVLNLIALEFIAVLIVPSLLLESTKLLFTAMGTYFPYLLINLILQALTKDDFKSFYPVTTIPWLLLIIISLIDPSLSLPLLWGVFLFGLFNLSYFIVTTISDLCHVLKIQPFTINVNPKKQS